MTTNAGLRPDPDPAFADWALPTFSLAERELRWGRVRELMRRFVVKPSIRYKGQGDVGHVGEAVAVTATGAERLGVRDYAAYVHVD